MKKTLFALMMISMFGLTGCGKISPLSPDLKQELNNQDGQIEDLRNNQNGLMLEMGKLRQQNEITARDIENFQQGLINLEKKNQNYGVQILQGDGALVMFFAIAVIGMMLIFYYRSAALRNEKAAMIMAQSIAELENSEVEDRVFMMALNTDVEKNVYQLLKKSQEEQDRRKKRHAC